MADRPRKKQGESGKRPPSTYFFSDVHLGLGGREEERLKENRLLDFLRGILPTAEKVFIVGDLFDFWFEYKTVIPKGFHRTLSMLDEFTGRGIPVHYVTGNHDFWMRDFFTRELGIHVHVDPLDVEIQGKKVHIHHGDGLATSDIGYRMIKPILRNRLNIWMYRWIHPDIGVYLAKRSSRSSREYTSGRPSFHDDAGMREYARQALARGLDVIIMGHSHSPLCEDLDRGLYINLGDWIDHNTYAEMRNGHIRLKQWTPTEPA